MQKHEPPYILYSVYTEEQNGNRTGQALKTCFLINLPYMNTPTVRSIIHRNTMHFRWCNSALVMLCIQSVQASHRELTTPLKEFEIRNIYQWWTHYEKHSKLFRAHMNVNIAVVWRSGGTVWKQRAWKWASDVHMDHLLWERGEYVIAGCMHHVIPVFLFSVCAAFRIQQSFQWFKSYLTVDGLPLSLLIKCN